MHFKFKKQVYKKVSLMKFQKVGTKYLICVFKIGFLSTYFAISHDPLDQSNSLSQANLKPYVSRKSKGKLLKN